MVIQPQEDYLDLPAIGCVLELSNIYKKVNFKSDEE